MSRAARRRDQVDASQSGVSLVVDQCFVGRSSAFAVLQDSDLLLLRWTRSLPTINPDGPPNSQWVTEQAKEFVEQAKSREHRPTHLVHDRDAKFTAEFKDAMKAAGIQCKKLPVRSPNLNARVERVIQTIKHECLQHFIVLGRDHLD